MSATNGGNPRLDRIEKLIEQSELANKKAHARFESNLRRWAALGVKEARNQRKRSAEMDKKFDKKMDQLASAQLLNEEGIRELKASQAVTEQMLQRFLSSLGRSGNGH